MHVTALGEASIQPCHKPSFKSNFYHQLAYTQVYCVLSAIRERKKHFLFTDGTTVALDNRVGFFITMNPGAVGAA